MAETTEILYTREQILAMPAGAEITVLVAEQVMGHRWMSYTRWPGESVRFLVPPGFVGDVSKNYDFWLPTSPPARIMAAKHVLSFATKDYAFSESMADAWEVLQKQANTTGEFGHGRKGFQLNEVLDVSRIVPLAQCQIGTAKATAEQHEMPLAICRTALLSVLGL